MADQDMMMTKAKDFWTRNSKKIIAVCSVIIIAAGAYIVYQNFIVGPKKKKSDESIFKAEEYFRKDSLNLALNGDGFNPGFLKIIDKYSGTPAANLANFYAGACYVKLDDNEKALKYLKKFDGGSEPIQARAYKLMGDAYGDLGKNKEAFDSYKKAASTFADDDNGSAESLFFAAYIAQNSLNDTKTAIELYKELKDKYPMTPQGRQSEAYLAQLGVYNSN